MPAFIMIGSMIMPAISPVVLVRTARSATSRSLYGTTTTRSVITPGMPVPATALAGLVGSWPISSSLATDTITRVVMTVIGSPRP